MRAPYFVGGVFCGPMNFIRSASKASPNFLLSRTKNLLEGDQFSVVKLRRTLIPTCAISSGSFPGRSLQGGRRKSRVMFPELRKTAFFTMKAGVSGLSLYLYSGHYEATSPVRSDTRFKKDRELRGSQEKTRNSGSPKKISQSQLRIAHF